MTKDTEVMNMARVELNEKQIEEVVGGAFNFYYDQQGAKGCFVDGVGNFYCNAEARDKLTLLKMQHKKDKWTAAQYVAELLAGGYFWPYNG